MIVRRPVAFLAFCCTFVAAPAHAGVVYVDRIATGATHNGTNWCNAFLTLDEALSGAIPGTTIRVANGAYKPNTEGLPDPRTATFRMPRGVAVEGGYAGCGAAVPDARDVILNQTVLSGDLTGNDGVNFTNYGDNVFHVVTVDDATTTNTTVLDGFTIRGGYANGTSADKTDQGSGIHIFNGVNPFTGRPLVRNCTIKENWAANHGAVNDHGGMTLINCEFRDNHAGKWGGGLYIHENLVTTVTDCRFYNNHTDGTMGGGGGVVSEGDATFIRCRLEGNTSAAHGGGMYNHGAATPTLIDCIFKGNSSFNDGGAIYNINTARPTMTRCVFEENLAGREGGGIWAYNGGFSAVSCLFRSNAASTISPFGTGGAIWHLDSTGDPQNPQPTLVNCVFVNNSALAGGALYLYGSRPTFTNCLVYGNTSNGADRAGILCAGDAAGGSHPVLDNCVLWNNGDMSQSGQLFISAASSAAVNHSCIQGWTGSLGGVSNIGANPSFVDADGEDGVLGTEDDEFNFAAGSPCIDAGNNAALPDDVTDLDGDGNTAEWVPHDAAGLARIRNAVVDMGSYEFLSGPAACHPGQFSATGIEPCQPCPTGTWRPDFGGTSCMGCPTNTYQPATGQTTCLPCGCDDDDACMTDQCHAITGQCQPSTPTWDAATACCNAEDGSIDALTSAGACMTASCSLPGSRGDRVLTPLVEGTACELNDPCFADEACDSAGRCVGLFTPGAGCWKNRYLTIPHGNDPGLSALRLTLIELHNPQPPNAPCCPAPDFSAFEVGDACADPGGCVRWVGPPARFAASQSNPTGDYFLAARLQCAPYYHLWSTEGAFYLIGGEIVPSSMYQLDELADTCAGDEETCADILRTVALRTARHGDIAPSFNPPSTTAQPDAIDVTQLVNKFKNVAGAPSKTIAQLQPNLPELNADINALDVVAVVDALKQRAYAFGGPCPCPSTVPCGSTSCTSPTPCVTAFGAGALCVKTCSGGDNDSDPCINNTHCPGSPPGTCGAGFCRDRCGRCTP